MSYYDGANAQNANLQLQGEAADIVSVNLGQTHACALFSHGKIKCWGNGGSGKLGYGDTITRGDGAGEMGQNLPFVDLGTGLSVNKIGAGYDHTCALFTNNKVKCWGDGLDGKLGSESIIDLGDNGGEMGDSLPYVNFGTGRTAVDISVGGRMTCAILDNNDLKCWGKNDYGQLGQGSIVSIGGNASDMGENLLAIDLGTGVYAVKVSASSTHVCVLLNNSDVKCWGRNDKGQLGLGDVLGRGDNASDMGENLSSVDIGAGTVTDLSVGDFHSCVKFNDGSLKCWGRGTFGTLGNESDITLGDNLGEMGVSLPTVDLNGTITSISSSFSSACALMSSGDVKCWGPGTNGRTGYGDTITRGDDPSEMGATLPTLDLGTGRSATYISQSSIAAGNCVVLDNNSAKCWGKNNMGQLGQGHTNDIGDVVSEMGDFLPSILLY